MKEVLVLGLSLVLVPSYSLLAKEPPNVTTENRQLTGIEQQQLENYRRQREAQIRQLNRDIQSSLEQSYENNTKWKDELNSMQQEQQMMEVNKIKRAPQLPNNFFR